MATLAYRDLAIMLLDTDSEMSKKLVKNLTNQTWASSKFTVPADMLFHKQKLTTTIDFAGVQAHQIEDIVRLNMIAGVSNHYYALDGKTFFIRYADGITTGGSNLNIMYYKIPSNTDVDEELRPMFLSLLMARLMPQQPAPQKK